MCPDGAVTVTARRTKADGAKTSEVQQSLVSSRDGGVVFRILNQPETQHRARSNIFLSCIEIFFVKIFKIIKFKVSLPFHHCIETVPNL